MATPPSSINVMNVTRSELLEIEKKIREIEQRLKTDLVPLEVGNGHATPVTAMGATEVVGPKCIEGLCEKITTIAQSIAAGARKYHDLQHQSTNHDLQHQSTNHAQKREQTTRRSYRQDSGIGSAYFPGPEDDVMDDDNKTTDGNDSLSVPIQESMETQEEGTEAEQVCTAVEHADDSDRETSHL